MKTKILLFFVTLCTAVSGHGQDTTGFQSFFGQESTEWHGVIGYVDVYDVENYRMEVDKDTIIQGQLYKKVLCYYCCWNNGDYYESRQVDLDMFLREDRHREQLWCFFPEIDTSFLIADMTVSLGDSIDLGIGSRYAYIVDGIDSTEMGKVINLSCIYHGVPSVQFIEGVGCTNIMGYLIRDTDPTIYNHLLCFHKDGDLVYHQDLINYSNYDEINCTIRMIPENIFDIETNNIIKVFPNPCDRWLTVQGHEILAIEVYDITCRLMKRISPVQSSIDVSNLPQGTYVIRIYTKASALNYIIMK